jgi:hypothetical protein
VREPTKGAGEDWYSSRPWPSLLRSESNVQCNEVAQACQGRAPCHPRRTHQQRLRPAHDYRQGETAQHFGYYVSRIPADFGLGFHFEKFGVEKVEGEPSEYDVNLDLQRGYHGCTCKGNTYSGHCKHVEALVSLIRAGKLAVPQQQPVGEAAPETIPEPAQSVAIPAEPAKPRYCRDCGCLDSEHVAGFCSA